MAAATRTGARLVFPANVWIYGRGRPNDPVDERRAPSPCSMKGRARASMEEAIRASRARFVMVRIPEFYGPHVRTLTGPPLKRLARGGTAMWVGPADRDVEFAFMPDVARALLEIGLAEGVDGELFHLPGFAPTTASSFLPRRGVRRGAADFSSCQRSSHASPASPHPSRASSPTCCTCGRRPYCLTGRSSARASLTRAPRPTSTVSRRRSSGFVRTRTPRCTSEHIRRVARCAARVLEA